MESNNINLYENVYLSKAKVLMHKICTGCPLRISLEEIEKLSEEIQLPTLAWVIAICEDNFLDFNSLERDNQLIKKFRIPANYYFSILHDIVIKLSAEEYSNINFYFTKNESRTEILNYKISSNYIKTILLKNEKFSGIFKSKNREEYFGDSISISIIRYILPELWPDKNRSPNSKQLNDLKWNSFCKLTEILPAIGAKLEKNNIGPRNKKNAYIKAIGKFNEPLDVKFESFRKTFQKKLFSPYLNDSSWLAEE